MSKSDSFITTENKLKEMKNAIKIGASLLLGCIISSCTKINDEYQYDDTLDVSWSEMADQVTPVLIDKFWNNDGYFNYGSNASDLGFQYWPNAHAMDVVIDAYERTGDAKYSAYFKKWFEGIKGKNDGSYYNVFYDDMEWNALTILRLYELTKEQVYLDAVKLLWTDILTAWNEEYAQGDWRGARICYIRRTLAQTDLQVFWRPAFTN